MLLKRMIKTRKHMNAVDLHIGDPCYDLNAPLTLNRTLPEGDYRFAYYMGAMAERSDFDRTVTPAELEIMTEDIKTRIFVLEIQRKGRSFSLDSQKWEPIGTIGVDSGIAGLFWNKPDNNDDDEWMSFCEKINEQKNGILLDDFGWYCYSGYGDGIYDVFAIIENDEIIAIKLCF